MELFVLEETLGYFSLLLHAVLTSRSDHADQGLVQLNLAFSANQNQKWEFYQKYSLNTWLVQDD